MIEPVSIAAVVDGPASERRLRHIGLPAEFGYLAEDLVVFHRGQKFWKVLGNTGGQFWMAGVSYHHLPNREMTAPK